MQYVSTICDMADLKPTVHFRPYPLQDVRSISEMAAMIRLRISGTPCGTCSRKLQHVTHPYKKEPHRITSGDLGGQRNSA